MTVSIFNDAPSLAEHAADLFIRIAQDAVRARGRFTVALAGGSTPEATYRLLAQPERAGQIEWPLAFIFFGDERFVPHDDPRSNYAMAYRTLLAQVPVPPGNVFPIPTEADTADEAAQAYAQTLETFFGTGIPHAPQFDLIFLGLGDDGHTASLFPGKPSLRIADALTAANSPGVLPPPVDRVTFTYPVLNAARHIVFLVAGEKKAAPVQAVLEGGAGRETHPAAGVQPADGKLVWLLDEAAAKLLTRRP